jgi:hypothetical protein
MEIEEDNESYYDGEMFKMEKRKFKKKKLSQSQK